MKKSYNKVYRLAREDVNLHHIATFFHLAKDTVIVTENEEGRVVFPDDHGRRSCSARHPAPSLHVQGDHVSGKPQRPSTERITSAELGSARSVGVPPFGWSLPESFSASRTKRPAEVSGDSTFYKRAFEEEKKRRDWTLC